MTDPTRTHNPTQVPSTASDVPAAPSTASALTPGGGSTVSGNDPDGTRSADATAAQEDAVLAGRYRLRKRIGEGGMGTVWLAEQTVPVRRFVAVKVIKAGMDSEAVLARFEAERQALALMDHPNIAKVLDAGSTADAPFFVMELVKGGTLAKFCDDQKPSVRQRLELFEPICKAVQHAHQKGVIHRDLKPGNVLVEVVDGKPAPKVIDFGLVKAVTAVPLTDRAAHTRFGAVLGTPPYMAPEQVAADGVDVDTRADVYALGVILYELLTGTTPIEKSRFHKLPLDEAVRLIREEEPPTPSTRLAQVRASDPGTRFGRDARAPGFADLDWIVMKAIAKERERRYETANGLAADVRRYLDDEPVLARPPTAGYRVRKFVRRNRPQVIAAGLVLAALVAGVVGTTAGLVWADAERRRAVMAETATADQLVKTREAERVAQEEAAKAKAAAELAETRARLEREARSQAERQSKIAGDTSRFLTEVLTLGRPDGWATGTRKPGVMPTVKQALDVAAEKIGTRFRTEPEIEMMVRLTVGITYRRLGEYAAARPHLTRCLELAERHYPDDEMVMTTSRHELAKVYAEQGEYKPAEVLFDQVVRALEKHHGPHARLTLSARNDLAQMWNTAAEYDTAEKQFHEILEAARRSDEDVSGVVCSASNNLGLLYITRKKYELAEPLLTAALKLARDRPAENPDTTAIVSNLANVYWGQKKYDLAEPLLKEAYERMHETHGDAHPTTLTVINNLAGLHLMRKEYGKAEQLMESAVAACRKSLGVADLTTLGLIMNLGTLYSNQDKYDRAEPLLDEAVKGLRKHAPVNHPYTLHAAYSLGEMYRSQKRYDLAEPLLVEAAEGREKKLSATHPETGLAVLRVIALYEAQKKHDRSEPWFRKRAAVVKGLRGADSAEYAVELSSLGRNLMQQKKYADAEPLLRDCLTVREKKAANTWAVPYTSSLIGECLTGRRKYADAEPLLLAAYDGMKKYAADIPPDLRSERTADVVNRVVELYAVWGKPEKAAEWRAKVPLETLPRPRADK